MLIVCYILNNNLENVSAFEDSVGLINAYEDKEHAVGLSYTNINYTTTPVIIIDGVQYFMTPFRGWSGHIARLITTELDISNQVWRMKYTFYVDGTEYVKYITLD